jgi:hypothetical protein
MPLSLSRVSHIINRLKFHGFFWVHAGAGRLTAFGETAEMAGHTAFLKTDCLATFRTGLTEKAVLMFVGANLLVLEVPLFENPADGIRDGQDQAVLLEHGVFSTDPLELLDNLFHRHP